MTAAKLPRKFVLAVAQVGGINLSDSRESVVKRLIEMLRESHARGAKFVVFPELTLTTFFPRYWAPMEEVINKYFEKSMPNTATQPLFDLAFQLGVGFYLGYAELTPEGRRFNTSILVDTKGHIVGKYHKIHLPGHDDNKPDAPFQHLEKKYFEVGEDPFKVWEVDGIKMGMCLCNDRRWVETWRVTALQGAELMVLGYNTPSHNIHWHEPVHLRMLAHVISMQSGAYQNAMWGAAAAKSGFEDGFNLIGGSMIVSPAGEIVAQSAYEDDEVITAKIDLDMCTNFRKNIFDFERHRRPEHYKLIVERTGFGDPLS